MKQSIFRGKSRAVKVDDGLFNPHHYRKKLLGIIRLRQLHWQERVLIVFNAGEVLKGNGVCPHLDRVKYV